MTENGEVQAQKPIEWSIRVDQSFDSDVEEFRKKNGYPTKADFIRKVIRERVPQNTEDWNTTVIVSLALKTSLVKLLEAKISNDTHITLPELIIDIIRDHFKKLAEKRDLELEDLVAELKTKEETDKQ